MSKAPVVSIIIPNYNHAPYLEQRIDSVLAQTFHDFEVILLDDCSKDNSREIIQKYQNDPRVRVVFNQSNSGCVFKQWNKGLKMATGQYIWLAESDDYSEPTFLATMVGYLEADPRVGVAFCDSFRVCGEEVSLARERWYREFASLYEQDFKTEGKTYVSQQMLFHNTIPNASSVVFRRSVAQESGDADETFLLSGDWLFWMKLLSRSNLAYVATPLNYYRYHQQTARHANFSNGVMIEEAYRITLFVLKHFPVAPEDAKKVRERLTSWFIEIMVTRCSSIPRVRQRNIRRLASELDSKAPLRLWLRRTGLGGLWMGIRRRVLGILQKVSPAQALEVPGK